MPTATAGIYEVILNQDYDNELIKNVFHYRNTLGEDDVQDLCALAFDEDLLAFVQQLQNTSLNYLDIRCKNLSGIGADAIQAPSVASGLAVGTEAASFISVPFRYDRTTKETRNGAKRFAAMVEENMVANGFTAAYQAIMLTSAAAFETEISTVGGVFEPIILRRVQIPEGTFTYNAVASVTPLNRQTTQNSRKVF